MKAKLTVKQEIASETLYTEFAVTEGDLQFKPGQFFRLTLLNPPYTDERGPGRFLGFTNTPSQKGVAATVTRKGPSAFKRSLFEAETGTEAEITGIDGKMTLPEETDTVIIIVTGGIGIAPIMSLLRREKELSGMRKITLLYSNTNQARAIWLPELTQYQVENPNFRLVATMTQDDSWAGEKRRIDAQFLKDYTATYDGAKYYITGTPRFVPAMVKLLREIGIAPAQTKFEIFTGY